MIRLYYNQYTDADPGRDKELRWVEARNKSLPLLAGIFPIPGRPSYQDMFSFAREQPDSDSAIHIFANADIFFDDTLRSVEEYYSRPQSRNVCLALSRWDVFDTDPLVAYLHEHADSQDAWILYGDLPDIPAAGFPMGKPGCDNRIAQLVKDAGWEVINPCHTIKAIHLHLSGVRNYIEGSGAGRGNRTKRGVIPGPYFFPKPQKLP